MLVGYEKEHLVVGPGFWIYFWAFLCAWDRGDHHAGCVDGREWMCASEDEAQVLTESNDHKG